MKNAIKYYYNLNPSDIHQVNKIYKFNFNKKKYMFYPCQRTINEINEIYELCTYLEHLGVYFHKIILNINNEIITKMNNEIYILLNINIENRKIKEDDIVYLSNIQINPQKFNSLKRYNWYDLWSNKIDYIEYQISQFGMKYPYLRESSDYYIGIVENCISILYREKDNSNMLTISHKRINKNTTTEDFYNPLTFIIDSRIRDISEYLKSFMLKENIEEHIKNFIYYNSLTKNEIELFFIRIIYPSLYFDKFESIIEKKEDEKEIIKIINTHKEYEKTIKKIYNLLRSISELPEIEWLKDN